MAKPTSSRYRADSARAIMHRLRMDQSALKRVQSDQAKAAMKRQLLPHYEGWIEGRSTATAPTG
jgi:hypothetical protein